MAEFHWPDFLRLFGLDDKTSSDAEIRKAILDNPHLVDWYFTERTEKFVKHWLYDFLKASWHWFRYEYASRGSIHCHGLAKLSDDPGLVNLTQTALKGFLSKEKLAQSLVLQDSERIELEELVSAGELAEKEVCAYVDKLLTALNPIDNDEWVKPKIHPCKTKFDIASSDEDYADLVNSVQRHTCNSAYCLRNKNGKTECRFEFPYECCEQTHLKFTKVNTRDKSVRYKCEIVYSRNDPRVNRHQRAQLQGWRANTDISVVIDYHSCVQYLTKYTSKPEKLSSVVKDTFSYVSDKVTHANFNSISMIKKLMMRSIGLRDMSIQEVCHQVLQLKLYSSSYEVISTSLDGSRKVDVEDQNIQSKPSLLDLYATRNNFTSDPKILNTNFITFVANYFVKNDNVYKRKKIVVVRTHPNYPSAPKGVHFGKYCKYNLVKFKPWIGEVASAWNNETIEAEEDYITAWFNFLQSPLSNDLLPNHLQELEIVEQYISNEESPSEKNGCI